MSDLPDKCPYCSSDNYFGDCRVYRGRWEFIGRTAQCYERQLAAVKSDRDALKAEVNQLNGALEMGQENCDAIYNDLQKERDIAQAKNMLLREALQKIRHTPTRPYGDHYNSEEALDPETIQDICDEVLQPANSI